MIDFIRANDSGSSAGASASGSGPEGRGFNSRLPDFTENSVLRKIYSEHALEISQVLFFLSFYSVKDFMRYC